MISSVKPLPIEIVDYNVEIPDEAINLIAELLLEVVDQQSAKPQEATQ